MDKLKEKGIIFLFSKDKKEVGLTYVRGKLSPVIMDGDEETITARVEKYLAWKDPLKKVGFYNIENYKVTIYASISTEFPTRQKSSTVLFFNIKDNEPRIDQTTMISIELALGNIYFDVSDN